MHAYSTVPNKRSRALARSRKKERRSTRANWWKSRAVLNSALTFRWKSGAQLALAKFSLRSFSALRKYLAVKIKAFLRITIGYFLPFCHFQGWEDIFLPKSTGICWIWLQCNIFKFKIWAALNSRSSLKIASGAKLSASVSLKERRSTRAREKTSGARERRSFMLCLQHSFSTLMLFQEAFLKITFSRA